MVLIKLGIAIGGFLSLPSYILILILLYPKPLSCINYGLPLSGFPIAIDISLPPVRSFPIYIHKLMDIHS